MWVEMFQGPPAQMVCKTVMRLMLTVVAPIARHVPTVMVVRKMMIAVLGSVQVEFASIQHALKFVVQKIRSVGTGSASSYVRIRQIVKRVIVVTKAHVFP